MAKPGKLDQRITFEQSTPTPDGGGGVTSAWSLLSNAPTVWAHVKANGGSERFEDDRTNATETATFTIRNRSDVNEVDRILWRGNYYNIRQVRREGAQAMYLSILAERGTAD